MDSACTLYARWTANNYDVVLNAQGGSGGSAVTATFDSAMPAISAPDKPGYLFGGYFDKENGGGTRYYNSDCSSAIIYDRAEGVTLYALWTPITYNIQLYSLGEKRRHAERCCLRQALSAVCRNAWNFYIRTTSLWDGTYTTSKTGQCIRRTEHIRQAL
ncbi:MAG: hypothetical protein L6V93_10425 [Clostridiales bacterium]|nr:MAG: hypothetical protein L6V93_10425 [Clostridiales bacterium]